MATSDNGHRPFPEDLDRNILLRLPVKSLLRFKCVCKNWYTLIKNPYFIREHLYNCSKSKSLQLLIYDYGALDGSPPITLISDHGVAPLHENLDYFQRFRGMTILIGSVDGIYLLERISDEKISYALWNPAIREVRPLPEPKIQFSTREGCFGCGLDPSTNDYKVVYFIKNRYAAVYSCSRDSCRIFEFTFKIFHSSKNCIVKFIFGTAYLNGAYYWLIREWVTEGVKCSFLSFDFSNEVFGEIDGPDHYSDPKMPILFDDSIALLNLSADCVYDIWVMIQPGVWNKRFTFQCFPYFKSWYSSTVIFVTKSSRLVSYNVKTQKTTHLGLSYPGLKGVSYKDRCAVYPYKESLVAIKRENEELGHCNYLEIFDSSIEL
ncbi:F-box/kelch-repeat protein At3g23880-like [Lycium barbarum]|uniref:F-box/kelch-repeat protein At3g23880-like n=1 Tax=Lycium barbarum TaxID=112863 RepID=UPI00293E9927|nr:F-box/kelch-repeat protein At3g23880-like [Lycium barbarum]